MRKSYTHTHTHIADSIKLAFWQEIKLVYKCQDSKLNFTFHEKIVQNVDFSVIRALFFLKCIYYVNIEKDKKKCQAILFKWQPICCSNARFLKHFKLQKHTQMSVQIH